MYVSNQLFHFFISVLSLFTTKFVYTLFTTTFSFNEASLVNIEKEILRPNPKKAGERFKIDHQNF